MLTNYFVKIINLVLTVERKNPIELPGTPR